MEMKNVKSFNQFVNESINESTTLNTIGISQKAIKSLLGGWGSSIQSHKLEFTPFSGTKKDVKNELEKGKSIIAKKDADNFIIVAAGRWWSRKPQFRTTIITDSSIEYDNNNLPVTKALGFLTKDYKEYYTFDNAENVDPSKKAKELGRGSGGDESEYYFISELAKEKYVLSYIVKILGEQLKDLRTKVSKWVLTYDGTTKFQVETPIGTTDWESTAIYRIGEIVKLIKAMKGNGEFGGKSGEELIKEFIERFIDVTEYDKVDGRENEKQAAKKALAELGKNIHWSEIAQGYGYYGGTFASTSQLKEDLT